MGVGCSKSLYDLYYCILFYFSPTLVFAVQTITLCTELLAETHKLVTSASAEPETLVPQ